MEDVTTEIIIIVVVSAFIVALTIILTAICIIKSTHRLTFTEATSIVFCCRCSLLISKAQITP